MPRISLKRLIKAHEKEKAGMSKYRLHAARLRKEGKDIREIARCRVWHTLPSGTDRSACTRAT